MNEQVHPLSAKALMGFSAGEGRNQLYKPGRSRITDPHQLGGLGEWCKLPQRDLAEPGRFCYFWRHFLALEHVERPFSEVFQK
jgi:hypothetical protein